MRNKQTERVRCFRNILMILMRCINRRAFCQVSNDGGGGPAAASG
jgi:hypothetical protein